MSGMKTVFIDKLIVFTSIFFISTNKIFKKKKIFVKRYSENPSSFV